MIASNEMILKMISVACELFAALIISDVSFLTMVDNSTAETDTFLQEAETYTTYKMARYIDSFWFPVLVPIGLVGYTLPFLVMIRSNNRKVSTCIYMAATSINDNAMMFWALWYFYSFENNPMLCKVIIFVSFLILQNSTFQILAMTIDKYIAI